MTALNSEWPFQDGTIANPEWIILKTLLTLWIMLQ